MSHKKYFIFLLLFLLCSNFSYGQASLSKKISLDLSQQRLENVLEILSNKAGFYFSYNSNTIKKDSLVSISVSNKTIREVLVIIFNNSCEFRESGNYIIIRKAPLRMTLITQQGKTEDKQYAVSGFVYDDQTGIGINEASIYEKRLLASALTNARGFFKLKLKSHTGGGTAALTVSKTDYEDTTVIIETRINQQLTVTLVPLEQEAENIIVKPVNDTSADTLALPPPVAPTENPIAQTGDSLKVEKSGWAKLLLSGKQKVQSLNLNKFFTTRPYQVSFIPAFGTHGKMSAQVVNNFSLNILGGYTAGTHGAEIGGLFNIDKKEVHYFQAAGLFNSVGGQVKGMQVAGITNWVLDSVKAFQAAGVNNYVKGKMRGFQLGGVYNHVTDSVRGMQAAGIANFSAVKTTGLQVAGVVNISRLVNGVQIAGIVNYTKKLKGLQIGLINIADTTEGYSIGLINITLKGYHILSISSNEFTQLNISYKSGNAKLYSILLGGLNTGHNNKIYSFGYGLGNTLPLNKKKTIMLQTELTTQYLYPGSWDYTNILNRANLNLNIKLGKYVALFAGPSYSMYLSDQTAGISGYRFPIPPSGYNAHVYSNKVSGWLGWNAGISIF